MTTERAAGRAWMPASTGLPEGRPPSVAEAREAWMRQARGVYRMTWAARSPAATLQRVLWLTLGLQALAGAAFVMGLLLLPASDAADLALAFHVVAVGLLLLAQLSGPGAMAADAVAEVAAKSAQAWSSSPMPTSAWVAGKVAYYLVVQALASLRFLPMLAASAALGGVQLRQVAITVLLGLAWTAVVGMGVASASLEPRPQLAARLGARGGLLARGMAAHPAFRGATPPAAGFAVMQIGLGIAGAFMLLPFAFTGRALTNMPPPVALVLAGIACMSPIAASITAYFPAVGVPVLGIHAPFWVISLVVALAVMPVAVAASRLRWRAPDGSLGLGVRPAAWLAWLAVVLVAMGVLSASQGSAEVAPFVLLPVIAFVASARAGMTRLPDLATGRATGWRRVAGLDRSTAHAFGLVLLALLVPLSALLTPSGTYPGSALLVALTVAACSAPLAVVGAAAGREARRGLARLEAGVKERLRQRVLLVLLVMVFGSVAPGLAAVAQSAGEAGLASAMRLLSLAGPVPLLVTAGRDVLGLSWPAFDWFPPALGTAGPLVAWVLQAGLAVLAHVVETRAGANDELASLPPSAE